MKTLKTKISIIGLLGLLSSAAFAGGIHCDDDPKCLPCVPGQICHNSGEASGGFEDRDVTEAPQNNAFRAVGNGRNQDGDSAAAIFESKEDAQKNAYRACSSQLGRVFFNVHRVSDFETTGKCRVYPPHVDHCSYTSSALYQCVIGYQKTTSSDLLESATSTNSNAQYILSAATTEGSHCYWREACSRHHGGEITCRSVRVCD